MLSPALQNILALALVALAAGWLVWHTLRPKKADGCGSGSGCGHCRTTSPENVTRTDSSRYVPLDALLSSDKDKQ